MREKARNLTGSPSMGLYDPEKLSNNEAKEVETNLSAYIFGLLMENPSRWSSLCLEGYYNGKSDRKRKASEIS